MVPIHRHEVLRIPTSSTPCKWATTHMTLASSDATALLGFVGLLGAFRRENRDVSSYFSDHQIPLNSLDIHNIYILKQAHIRIQIY